MKIHRFAAVLATLLASPAFAQAPAHLTYYAPDNAAIIGNNSADWSSSIRINQDAHSFWVGGSHRMWIKSTGNVGIGTTDPQGKLHVVGSFADGIYQDGSDRPSLGLTGLYPQTVLMAGATGNTNHGATVMLGSFDSGASGAHKHWSIGTAGQNSTFLDIGYHAGTDLNPHAGIRNYNGATVLTLLNSGNVGIGTSNPIGALDVRANQGTIIGNGLYFWGSGNLADGLPAARLIENWGIRFNSNDARWVLSTKPSLLVGYQPDGRDWGTDNLYVLGNVGIGTTNPTHKLAVNGTIKAKEVIVETTGWSDYVFADDYTLAPLAEVEAHIKEHKHLPGIPSAAQVADRGVSVGDMQARLLAKIEELTLHQIAQEKRAVAQERELTALKTENAHLKSRMQRLETR